MENEDKSKKNQPNIIKAEIAKLTSADILIAKKPNSDNFYPDKVLPKGVRMSDFRATAIPSSKPEKQ